MLHKNIVVRQGAIKKTYNFWFIKQTFMIHLLPSFCYIREHRYIPMYMTNNWISICYSFQDIATNSAFNEDTTVTECK